MTNTTITSKYYTAEDGTELIDVLRAWRLSYTRGCMIKYIVRAGRKPDEEFSEAIDKALNFADLEQREPKHLTPAELGEAFGLNDEQTAAIYACVFGSEVEILRTLLSCSFGKAAEFANPPTPGPITFPSAAAGSWNTALRLGGSGESTAISATIEKVPTGTLQGVTAPESPAKPTDAA